MPHLQLAIATSLQQIVAVEKSVFLCEIPHFSHILVFYFIEKGIMHVAFFSLKHRVDYLLSPDKYPLSRSRHF